jgi:hypothetical protein
MTLFRPSRGRGWLCCQGISGSVLFGACVVSSLLGQIAPSGASGRPKASDEAIKREVYHALITLRFYTVFDDLEFRVVDHSVTLFGQVTDPTLKGDAEKAVMLVGGVHR